MNQEIKNRNIWVYDVETFKRVFTYCAINIDTEEIVKFVIHKDRDDRDLLIEHLQDNCKGHIGFNNISFDYPIIHYFLNEGFYSYGTSEELIDGIYNKAQELINEQSFGGFDKNTLWEKDYLIKQLDLFKLWHFNNSARRTSLKALEIAMNFPNVMESSIHHNQDTITLEEVEEVLAYNVNDILATFEFYKRSKDKINLRLDLNNRYKLACNNFSDSKIGEELVLSLYCNKIRADKWKIEKLRTNRSSIALKDCIFDYIKFETTEFNQLLTTLKSKTITETKGAIKESVLFKGSKYIYGTGGIHACCKTGIYEPNEDELIISCDVALK